MKRIDDLDTTNHKQVQNTAKVGRKKKPKFTTKHAIYAQTFVETGSKQKAAEVSGYKPSKLDKNKSLQYLIDNYKKQMEKKFITRADEMTEALYNLIQTTQSDTVKLNAIKDWLDRAGLAPVNKSEVEQKKIISTESQVSRDLLDRLQALKDTKNE